jgi:CBS-domain-containing membrane protein
MEKNRIRHLPVVAGDLLVGMISQRELYLYLTTFAVYSEGQVVKKKKPEELVEIRIEEIMSRDPYTVGRRATIEDAARTMSHHRLSALPVVDEGKRLLGIITTQDILVYLSDEYHPDTVDGSC